MTRWPRRERAAAACIRSVDLPMPGSPPISTAEPRTKPPPVATVEFADIPEWMRGASSDLARKRRERNRPALLRHLARGRNRCRPSGLPRRRCSTRRSRRISRPSGSATVPQFWQTNWVLGLSPSGSVPLSFRRVQKRTHSESRSVAGKTRPCPSFFCQFEVASLVTAQPEAGQKHFVADGAARRGRPPRSACGARTVR
jgi:hypothetical protein